MDGFELNKIAGAVLFSVLALIAVGQLSSMLVAPSLPEKTAYPVPESADGGSADKAADAASDQPSLGALLAEANVESGQKVAKKCTACHTFNEGGANRVGPNLYSVLNNDIASVDGYAYSSALQDMEGTWTYEALDAFLANPRAAAAGTKMAFAGVRRANQRADLILYLRSLGDEDAELPAAE